MLTGVIHPWRTIFVPVNMYSGEVKLERDRLPLPNLSIDVIFTKSVLEYIHKPANILSECYRVLKYGGRIIVFREGLLF